MYFKSYKPVPEHECQNRGFLDFCFKVSEELPTEHTFKVL